MTMLKSHCLVFIGENGNAYFAAAAPVTLEFIELVPYYYYHTGAQVRSGDNLTSDNRHIIDDDLMN